MTSEALPSNVRRNRLTAGFLAGYALLLLPFCFWFGYGSDNDTFGVLEAGRSTWLAHVPMTSRHPGYWVFEALTTLLDQAGGHVLTNLATMAVGLFVLWRFIVISTRLGARFPRLCAACVAATPVFFIACCSTIDYVWSLAGLVLFMEMLVADHLLLAVLPAAFCFAIRGSNGVLIAGAIAGAIVFEVSLHSRLNRRSWKLAGVGMAAAVLGGLPYIESYRLAGHSMDFVTAMAGPASMWTAKMRIGRFGYKMLYLFGPLGWIGLAAAGTVHRAHPARPIGDQTYRLRAMPILIGIVIANLLLFFQWSIEISYLIPGAFFLFLILSVGRLAARRSLTAALLATIALSNFITIRLAVPNTPGRATGAAFRPGLEPGDTLDDLHKRYALRHCVTYDCWVARNIEPRAAASAEPAAAPAP